MKQIIITLLVFTSLSMLAQRNNDRLLYPVIEGGIHFGGDELATLTFVNGDEQIMRAGQGGLLALGVELVKPKDPRLRVRSTIGVKYNTTAAEDVNISFIRFPFAISSLYNWDNGIRFGAGLSYHFAPKFSGDEILPDYNFNSGLGRRVEEGRSHC